MARYEAFVAGFLAVFAVVHLLVSTREHQLKLDEEAVRGWPLLTLLMPLLNRLKFIGSRLRFRAYRERTEVRLLHGGRPGRMGPDEFVAFKLLLALLCGLATLPIAMFESWLILPIIACFGAVLPDVWLSSVIRKRQKAIRKELPFALDLLTLSVEAGMDFIQALENVARNSRPGPLRGELEMMHREIQLGMRRSDALKGLDRRVGVTEVSSVVTFLVQSEEVGSSLGPVLRILADETRARRFAIAEKEAAKAPVKIILPLVVFIFPSIFLIIAGPIILRVMQVLPELGGTFK